jgi:LmbE family N-acetylglucosaminyl deacetylase
MFVAAAAATLIAAPPTLPQDRGAAGTWQLLLKLQTTASALHTTAHPDDEHGGVLALLSRRDGARVSLMTLNRGEAGDNAIGPQLFDGLGLIRTEELLIADAYYGVGAQYFTTAVDYGFSKRVDEALDKWGRDAVLRDVVRIIRMDRPFVLISRFQGNPRDGHGNHETAGVITPEAFKAAGDAKMFPEQIAEGLRPWQPFKVYIGGQRENEDWTIRVDPGEYSPWLGDSYNNFARLGLSFERSQNSGRYAAQLGPAPGFYTRVGSTVAAPDKERSFFDGIDTTIPGLFKTLGLPAPAGGDDALRKIEQAVKDAVAAFSVSNPAASVPALARGLEMTRSALAIVSASPDAVFTLKVKEQQFQDAINTALGIELVARAQPAGTAAPTGPAAAFAPPATMGAPVPGQTFEIVTELANRSATSIEPAGITIDDITIDGAKGWNVQSGGRQLNTLGPNQTATRRFTVELADDVPISTRPYFTRASIADNRYIVADPSQFGRPASTPPAVAVAHYTVNGVRVEAREIVRRREGKLPYGDALRELRVVPALALTVEPGAAIITMAATHKRVTLRVDLLNNHDGTIAGRLALKMPAGWTSAPAAHEFAFTRAGERRVYSFTVSVPSLEDRTYSVDAIATANGRAYLEGYDLIDERDLELRYLYRPATTTVRGVAVTVPARLKVGYVMGIGDQVPSGIAQLGHTVTLLGERELATASLQPFDAIVTGTRAYAVRDDLRTYNQRLLDYVKAGGNLVVLYNTAELVPARFAPYPGELTARAEEVSEEDSPVNILAPADQVFNWPNRITKADFDGWVEQRGSKFWSSWAPEYAPMIETWDKGQAPQKGGWLSARYGKGRYTYFAYAFHRQLPYGVPGAYRLLENVLSLTSTARTRSTERRTSPGIPPRK